MYSIREIKPKYSNIEISDFKSNHDFMDAYVELLKDSIECLYNIVYIKYYNVNDTPKKINRDDAIIGGNLVRLIKLNISFLENVCNGKTEICLIINRCLAETYINLKYLLINGEDNVKRNYIKNSLITEKELWNVIKENINSREEDTLNIEKRMQISINNSFEKSDFEIEDINKSSKWKSIKNRAESIAGDQFYSVFYGIASHSIHGNWQDILTNNLEKFEDGFMLNLSWYEPKPQLMDTAIIFNIDIVKVYLEYEFENINYAEQLKRNYNTLLLYERTLNELHEKFLQQKNNL